MNTPPRKYAVPQTVDVGRGPEPARITYRRRNFKLPPAGAYVPANGEEGNFWLRRKIEGGVELFDSKEQAEAAAKKPAKKKTEKNDG